MVKWTYRKERSFASNYVIFLKILFQFKNLIKSWLDISATQIPIFVLFASAGVLFDGTFSRDYPYSQRCLRAVADTTIEN